MFNSIWAVISTPEFEYAKSHGKCILQSFAFHLRFAFAVGDVNIYSCLLALATGSLCTMSVDLASIVRQVANLADTQNLNLKYRSDKAVGVTSFVE